MMLDSSVDNSESVVTEWSGLQSIPEYRYSVTDAMKVSVNRYIGNLTITLADQDDGTYTCTATVTGGANVQSATASDAMTITVMGKDGLCITSVYIHVFLTLSFTCSLASSSSDHI